MKRIIFVLLMLSVTIAGNAGTKTVDSLTSIVNEYSAEPGCEVVSVGKLGINIARFFVNLSAETKEDKDVVALFDKLNKLLVVDYEGMEVSKRQQFNSKLTDLFAGVEKIIEVKDEEDVVNIYGTLGNGGETLEDVIIYLPEDYALICFIGSIDFDKLSDLIKASNESI